MNGEGVKIEPEMCHNVILMKMILMSRPDLADVSCHGAHLEAAGAGVRLLADEVGVVLLCCLPAPG